MFVRFFADDASLWMEKPKEKIHFLNPETVLMSFPSSTTLSPTEPKPAGADRRLMCLSLNTDPLRGPRVMDSIQVGGIGPDPLLIHNGSAASYLKRIQHSNWHTSADIKTDSSLDLITLSVFLLLLFLSLALLEHPPPPNVATQTFISSSLERRRGRSVVHKESVFGHKSRLLMLMSASEHRFSDYSRRNEPNLQLGFNGSLMPLSSLLRGDKLCYWRDRSQSFGE